MNRSVPLQYRPHHFLCTVGFVGKGYSPDFVANFARIQQQLESDQGHETWIEVVEQTDSICAPCPNRRESLCETQSKIETLDRSHSEVLGLKPGNQIQWGNAKRLVAERFSEERMEEACAPCSWRELGVCQSALRKLKSSLGIASLFLVALTISANQTWGATPPLTSDQTLGALRISVGKLKNQDPRGAISALEGRKFPQEWIDHTHVTEAAGRYELALTYIQKGPLSQALTELDRAASLLKAVRKLRPDSAWLEEPTRLYWRMSLEKRLALVELRRGQVFVTLDKKNQAIQAFDRAFQLLTTFIYPDQDPSGGEIRIVQHYAWITTPEFSSFVKACGDASAPPCAHWVRVFASFFGKSSVEGSVFYDAFPKIAQSTPSGYWKLPPGQKPAPKKETTEKSPEQIANEKRKSDLLTQFVTAIRERDYDDLKEISALCLKEFANDSSSLPRYRYWNAKAISEDDSREAAAPLFQALWKEKPFDYYGLLAGLEIGTDPFHSFPQSPLPILPDEHLSSSIDAARIKRARLLRDYDLKEYAALELQSLSVLDPKKSAQRSKASSSSLLYLIQELHQSGLHLSAFGLLDPLLQRKDETIYRRSLVEIIFPTAYFSLIERESQKNGLDPIFVLSLIKQESGFEQQILSRVGAEGLMQLMHYTAREVFAKVFGAAAQAERREILDPELNIQLGTAYLKQLSDRFNGNGAFMLSAYNAGPSRVDTWKKNGAANAGFLEYVEQIPFSETRGYVSRIFRNYVFYKSMRENIRIGLPVDDSSGGVHPFWNR